MFKPNRFVQTSEGFFVRVRLGESHVIANARKDGDGVPLLGPFATARLAGLNLVEHINKVLGP